MYKNFFFTPKQIKEIEATYHALKNNIVEIAGVLGLPSSRVFEYEDLFQKEMKKFILSLSNGPVPVTPSTRTFGYARLQKRIPIEGTISIVSSDPDYELYWCEATNDIQLQNKKGYDTYGYAVRNGFYTEGEAYKYENDPKMLSYKIQDDFHLCMNNNVELISEIYSEQVTPKQKTKSKKLAVKPEVETEVSPVEFNRETELAIQNEITEKQEKKEKEKKMAERVQNKEVVKSTDNVVSKITRKASAARVLMAKDAVEAAKRLAVDEILTLSHDALANVLVSGMPLADRDTTKGMILQSLASPQGAAFMALMVGGAMTAGSDLVPEEYLDIFNDIAQEFRVNAQVRAGRMLIDHLKPTIGSFVVNATSKLAGVAKAKEELAQLTPNTASDPAPTP